MLDMRGGQEYLNYKSKTSKIKETTEYTEPSTKTRTGETVDPKARHKYNKKIFWGNGEERDPYVVLKK